MKTIITNSSLETQKFAEELAHGFKQGGIIALTGDLGAGKTTFVQGFAQGLGIKDKIISPTFVLIRQHQIPNAQNIFYHLDLYRLEEPIDIVSIGLKDLFRDLNNVILIEWADKLGQDFLEKATEINIKKIDENSRQIEILT